MPVDRIDEQELRDALKPLRPNREEFAAGVRERMQRLALQADEASYPELPPLARAAASFLPLQLLTGGKAAAVAPALSGGSKLLGAVAFPAISLFLLLGASLLGVVGLRRSYEGAGSEPADAKALRMAVEEWQRTHRWRIRLVWFATLALMAVGLSGLLFAFYIVSFGILVLVLRSLARRGLGNRAVVARSCCLSLTLLGLMAISFTIGQGSIHFVDQRLIGAALLFGALALLPIAWRYPAGDESRLQRYAQRAAMVLLAVILIPLIAWQLEPLVWPMTPARIRRHVESFTVSDENEYPWLMWATPARWTVEAGLQPDLSRQRVLFEPKIRAEKFAHADDRLSRGTGAC